MWRPKWGRRGFLSLLGLGAAAPWLAKKTEEIVPGETFALHHDGVIWVASNPNQQMFQWPAGPPLPIFSSINEALKHAAHGATIVVGLGHSEDHSP